MKDQPAFESTRGMEVLSKQITALLNQLLSEGASEELIRQKLEEELEKAKKEGWIAEATITKFGEDKAAAEKVMIEVNISPNAPAKYFTLKLSGNTGEE